MRVVILRMFKSSGESIELVNWYIEIKIEQVTVLDIKNDFSTVKK